jgi:D-arabinose 5-phosphate isomerase GutQ
MMNWECEAKEILEIEAAAILRASERLDASFEQALDLLDGCVGKVITTGVGKSGIAARKLAATLTSTGCAAVYLHPAEAMHGDLGIVEADDVVVALSNSGESEEVLAILPAILARNVPILAIVGNTDSTLSRKAAVTLDASIEREACPLNLAPTTSVVVAMALGDALAMTLEKRRGFRPEDYALNHPGGRLGRRLTLRVRDVMAGSAGCAVAGSAGGNQQQAHGRGVRSTGRPDFRRLYCRVGCAARFAGASGRRVCPNRAGDHEPDSRFDFCAGDAGVCRVAGNGKPSACDFGCAGSGCRRLLCWNAARP